jgi:hypothetical protein
MQSYGNAILTEWNALNRKLDELIHAIRTELGLETSLERLRRSTTEMEAAIASATQDLNAAVPSAFQEMMLKRSMEINTM